MYKKYQNHTHYRLKLYHNAISYELKKKSHHKDYIPTKKASKSLIEKLRNQGYSESQILSIVKNSL
jgi:hypothetical protein